MPRARLLTDQGDLRSNQPVIAMSFLVRSRNQKPKVRSSDFARLRRCPSYVRDLRFGSGGHRSRCPSVHAHAGLCSPLYSPLASPPRPSSQPPCWRHMCAPALSPAHNLPPALLGQSRFSLQTSNVNLQDGQGRLLGSWTWCAAVRLHGKSFRCAPSHLTRPRLKTS